MSSTPLTEAHVREGYRWLLGREAESDQAVQSHLSAGLSLEGFRQRLLDGPEFLFMAERAGLFDRVEGYRHGVEDALPEDHARRIFLRLPQVGSDQVMRLFSDGTAQEVRCPEEHNGLLFRSAVDLAAYGAFAGFFDRSSLRLIPGRRQVLLMLAEPKARLVRVYRHLRAYDEALVERMDFELCRLAKRLDLADFLAEGAQVAPTVLDNGYARALGGPLPKGRWEAARGEVAPLDPATAVEAAGALVDEAVVGIFEDLPGARRVFAQALACDVGDPLRERHDDVVYQGRYDWEPFEGVDPRADDLLERLTQHDAAIYARASSRFDDLSRR